MKVIQRHLYLFLLFIGYVSTSPTTDISVEKYIKFLSESKSNNSKSSEPNIVWNLHMKYVPKPRLFQRGVIQIESLVDSNILNSASNTTTIEPPIELLMKMGILKPKSEENSANIQKVFITCSFKILFCVIFIILL